MASKKVKKAAAVKTYPYFEIYQDGIGEWRWVIKARNGQIIADSGEGYETHANVERAVGRLNDVDWPLFVEEGEETFILVPEPLPEPKPRLVFTIQPQSTQTGQTLPMIQVTAQNANGSTATGFNGPVTLTLGSQVGLAGTRTVLAVNGTATFLDLSIATAGMYVLIASALGFRSVKSMLFSQVTPVR